MNKKNKEYLIALYWLSNRESFNTRFSSSYMNTQCPLLKENPSRLQYVTKNGCVTKGCKNSMDRCINYYFSDSQKDVVISYIETYTQEQLEKILKDFKLVF